QATSLTVTAELAFAAHGDLARVSHDAGFAPRRPSLAGLPGPHPPVHGVASARSGQAVSAVAHPPLECPLEGSLRLADLPPDGLRHHAAGSIRCCRAHLPAQPELAVHLHAGHALTPRIESLVLFAPISREARERGIVPPLTAAGARAREGRKLCLRIEKAGAARGLLPGLCSRARAAVSCLQSQLLARKLLLDPFRTVVQLGDPASVSLGRSVGARSLDPRQLRAFRGQLLPDLRDQSASRLRLALLGLDAALRLLVNRGLGMHAPRAREPCALLRAERGSGKPAPDRHSRAHHLARPRQRVDSTPAKRPRPSHVLAPERPSGDAESLMTTAVGTPPK